MDYDHWAGLGPLGKDIFERKMMAYQMWIKQRGIEDTPENYKKFNYNLSSQLMGKMAPEEQTEKEEIEQPDNNSDYPFGHIMSEQRFNEISCMLSGMDWPVEKQIKRVCPPCGREEINYKTTNLTPPGPNTFKKCARCRAIYYCSKECQVKHWPIHKLNVNQQSNKVKKGFNVLTKDIALYLFTWKGHHVIFLLEHILLKYNLLLNNDLH